MIEPVSFQIEVDMGSCIQIRKQRTIETDIEREPNLKLLIANISTALMREFIRELPREMVRNMGSRVGVVTVSSDEITADVLLPLNHYIYDWLDEMEDEDEECVD